MDTDDKKIQEIRAVADRMRRNEALVEKDKGRLYELIQQVFPELRGERAVRGRLTEVAEASGWTREYVARIRDGKA